MMNASLAQVMTPMFSSSSPITPFSMLYEASLSLARCRTGGEILACIDAALIGLAGGPAHDVVWWGSGKERSLLRGGAPIETPDALDRARLAEGQIAVAEGIAYIPLLTQDQLQGWIAARVKEPLDLALTIWGGQCASAFAMVDAAASQRERVVIDEIAQVLSSTLQLDVVLEKIATMVGELVEAQGFYIALIDDETRKLSFAYINLPEGNPDGEMRWTVDEGLTGVVIRTGEPVCTSDYLQECVRHGVAPRGPAGSNFARAWLGVPLRHKDHTLGVMVVTHDDPNVRFDSTDVQLLATVAAQAAAAVANAQLYTRTQQQASRLALINRIGRTIASTLDPCAVPMLLVSELADAIEIEAAFVLICDGEDGELEIRYAQPDLGLISRRVPAGAGITHAALQRGKTVIEYDVHRDRLSYGPADGTGQLLLRSVMCVPLLGRRVRGVIALHNKRSGHFTKADIELVEAVAEQAAIALDNAELYGQTDEALTVHLRDLEQRNYQLAEVVRIGNALRSTFSIQQLSNQITQTICSITAAPRILLALVNPDRSYLRITSVVGFSVDPAKGDQEQWLMLVEFEDLLRRGERIGAFTRCAGCGASLPGFEDAIVITIRQPHGELVGAIALEVSGLPAGLSADQVGTLEIIVNQAGTALHNALLYTEQQQTVDRLTALNALSLAVSTARLSVDDVMNMAIAGAIGTTGGAVGGASVVFEGRPAMYYGTAASDGSRAFFEALHADEGDYIELTGDQVPASIGDTSLRRMLVVPLRGAKLTVGTLWIGYRQRAITQAEREMAVLYAKMAGAVIENIYLAEAVHAAHDRMASILGSTHEGMLLVGEDQQITMVNRAFSHLLGIDGQGLQGLTIDAFCGSDELTRLPQEIRQPLCDALMTTIAGATEVVEGELRLQSGNESDLSWQVLPVRTAGSQTNGALLVVRDVTADRQMERFRQDLANMIVHDLRSPLTNMMVSVDLLLKRGTGPLTEAQARILGIASNSCQQMLDLVNALLDIRRLEQRSRDLERRPIDIAAICETVVERLERTAEDRRVHLVINPSPVPPVQADPDMIRRVLQNLVDNAIKFSSPGGTVTIHSFSREAAELPPGDPSGEWVVVEVEDCGIGIAEEYHQVIFELFAQTPEGRGHGTGLGLAFCKLAVEAHGGKIWVRSAPGEGSSFFFTLPVER